MAVNFEYKSVSPVGLSPIPPAPPVHVRHVATHVHHDFLFAAAVSAGSATVMAAVATPSAGSLQSS